MNLNRRMLLAAPSLLLVRPGAAQGAWPTRAIRLISSSPPAGASDILSRTLGNSLQMQFGQSIVVENRPGGGGIIGADAVAKAPPDGYTWLTTAVASQAINATLMHQPYDPRKDFRQVTIYGRLPLVLLVNKDLPVKTLGEYVALAKAKPGALNFGTGGVGTLHHLTGELLKIAAGIDIVHVPYRGAQASTQDVIGGRIESMFDSLPSAAPHIRSGLMRAIAVSGPQRSPTFPDISTIAEQGYPSIVTTNWFGMAGPAGVPDEIVAKMHSGLVTALSAPDIKNKLADLGVEPGGDTPDATQAFVLREIDRWAKVIQQTGTKIN